MSEQPQPAPAPDGAPWYVKLGSTILSERGLGTLLSIVFAVAILFGGYTLLNDMRAFQTQIIAEMARTNEKLVQIQHELERIERLMVGAYGTQP
jgi:hypothetical protein